MRHGALERPFGTASDFPSFSEGLSLRPAVGAAAGAGAMLFPFLFGGTFIEAGEHRTSDTSL